MTRAAIIATFLVATVTTAPAGGGLASTFPFALRSFSKMTIGPFHRLESPTQTKETAKLQEASGEVWGRTPRWGYTPTVQAYTKALPAGQRGIEFLTDVLPEPYQAPHEARWYLGHNPGVYLKSLNGEDFACIKADVKNFQP